MRVVESVRNKSVNRLASLDAFRGITIALMLIGDNPGNPLRVYPQLRHAHWNGWTIADLAFPFFILIMGMAIPFAYNKRLDRGDSWLSVFGHTISRSILLFLIGLFLNGFPLFDLTIIRIPGVLQRIAFVYFFTGIVYLLIKKLICVSQLKKILIVLSLAFGIITIYSWIFNFGSVPEQGNLIQKIDLLFLKGHLYTPDWDPEGIISTFPAIASGIFGLVAGQILAYYNGNNYRMILPVLSLGVFFLIIGISFQQWIPINKNTWSSTYILFTSGLAYILVSLLFIFNVLFKKAAFLKPFIVLGSSPILIYVLSEIVRKTLWVIPVTSEVQNKTMPMNVWLTTTFFTPWAGEWLDSIYFSVFYVLLWIFILSFYRTCKCSKRSS